MVEIKSKGGNHIVICNADMELSRQSCRSWWELLVNGTKFSARFGAASVGEGPRDVELS